MPSNETSKIFTEEKLRTMLLIDANILNKLPAIWIQCARVHCALGFIKHSFSPGYVVLIHGEERNQMVQAAEDPVREK